MKLFKYLTLAATLSMGATCLTAQDFEKARAAQEAGDYQTAINEWLPLAERGDAASQYHLGALYYDGKGVLPEGVEPVGGIKLFAEDAYAYAQGLLGIQQDDNLGIPKDLDEAAKWYRLAAEQDHTQSQINLGVMYAKGEGVPTDYIEAAKWLGFAAAKDDAQAQFELAQMHHYWNHPSSDPAEAIRLYRLAASQDLAAAQFELARMYWLGHGVKSNDVLVHMWLSLSSENGHEPAVEVLADFETNLSPKEISRSQEIALKCRNSGYINCFE